MWTAHEPEAAPVHVMQAGIATPLALCMSSRFVPVKMRSHSQKSNGRANVTLIARDGKANIKLVARMGPCRTRGSLELSFLQQPVLKLLLVFGGSRVVDEFIVS